MTNNELPDELRQTAERVRSDRPELDSHGLDRVRERILGGAQHTVRRSRRSLAITVCLALGFAFTGTGTGLAVSGLASDGAATQAQYVRGTQAANTLGEPGDPGTRGASVNEQTVAANGSGKLPFTGSASLVILALGAVFLVSGAVVRWRTLRDTDV